MKPNILFAFADDWGRYASAYAPHQASPNLNKLIQTPHFDRVASEGALFRNALAPAPTCTPVPTKAWMIHNREQDDVEPLYQLGFGKRPREELYDLGKDPDYMNNVATDPQYEPVRARMEARLMVILEEQNDPRLMEQPCRFELEPYAGPVTEEYLKAMHTEWVDEEQEAKRGGEAS